MISFKKFIPGIAWFFLVLTLICLPGDDLPQASTWMDLIHFDKCVHIGLFSMLGFLFMWPFVVAPASNKKKLQTILKIAIAVILWGITTEFIQKYYIPKRSFDLFDWAADSAGAVLAHFAAMFVIRKRDKHR